MPLRQPSLESAPCGMLGSTMTLPLRRTLALLFAALFVVVALASIAYGRGYRFDFRSRHIRLTGVILLAGGPNRVQVAVDDGEPKSVSLPTTIRGLLPTTHTVTLSAPGYASQVFTFNVRSGQTTFATEVQLYKSQPFKTVRSGIPPQAKLSPDGASVAWLEPGSLVIANPVSTKRVKMTVGVNSLNWTESSENIVLQDDSLTVRTAVSREGAVRPATYVLPTAEQAKIKQLLNGRMVYSAAQAIPGTADWLLSDASSAWVLQANGDLTLATRWGNAIVNAIHLGRSSLATVRRGEVLIRNTANDQTALYEISAITQASAGVRAGEVNLLVTDGDLLQWERGNVF